jgi:hypothetical protein
MSNNKNTHQTKLSKLVDDGTNNNYDVKKKTKKEKKRKPLVLTVCQSDNEALASQSDLHQEL